MDSSRGTAFALTIDGLRVQAVDGFQVASLRHFDPAGNFAAAVNDALGEPVPQPLRASRSGAVPDAQVILAWRSPTETLLFCKAPAVFAALEQRLASAADGCMVDQTGGICVFRVQGERGRDLLQRLGATSAIPGLGEACAGRLAEVQVLTVCVQTGEFLLFIERAYADHLAEWIRATVEDYSHPGLF